MDWKPVRVRDGLAEWSRSKWQTLPLTITNDTGRDDGLADSEEVRAKSTDEPLDEHLKERAEGGEREGRWSAES